MNDKPIVLIVDDVPANVQVLASCLKDKYHIKVATDGSRCLELIADKPVPDLILLDIEMPGMDGYEVCRQLKQNAETKNIPVIFVTANDQEEDEEKGLQLGAVDYITKPIRPSIVAARVNTHITLKLQYDKLTAMAIYDQLTGLYNRYYLFIGANNKLAKARRHHLAVSLIMMDIDHFKHVNDQYGHPQGDIVLQAVSKIIVQHSREEDIAARFGGEEFIIILDHCDAESAQAKAEKYRSLIEAAKPEQIEVTSSFGVAQMNYDGETVDSLIKRADQALYQAKENGRNQVVLAE